MEEQAERAAPNAARTSGTQPAEHAADATAAGGGTGSGSNALIEGKIASTNAAQAGAFAAAAAAVASAWTPHTWRATCGRRVAELC